MVITPIEKTEIFTDIGRMVALSADASLRCNFEQDEGETDWTTMKNISATWNLANISTVDCYADTLIVDAYLKDGDTLIIRKDDSSLVTMIASGVTGSGPYTMDTSSVTGGEIPFYVFKDDCVLKYDGIVAQKIYEDVISNTTRNLFKNPSFTYNVDYWEVAPSTISVTLDLYGNIRFSRATTGSYTYPRFPLVIGRRYTLDIGHVSGYYVGNIACYYHSGALLQYNGGIVSFTAIEDSAYFHVNTGTWSRCPQLSVVEDSVYLTRHYPEYKRPSGTRSIEMTFDIPIKGSELVSFRSSMYKVGG